MYFEYNVFFGTHDAAVKVWSLGPGWSQTSYAYQVKGCLAIHNIKWYVGFQELRTLLVPDHDFHIVFGVNLRPAFCVSLEHLYHFS